eukprot:evm.model.scf_85EXC.4 EVM.evm.TU.scf_85EXC.4   scf_85EXC:34355-35602(+)
MDMRNAMRSLQPYCDDVPSPQILMSLLASEKLMTVDEFLEAFDSPNNIDLDSENIWPMPPSVECT